MNIDSNIIYLKYIKYKKKYLELNKINNNIYGGAKYQPPRGSTPGSRLRPTSQPSGRSPVSQTSERIDINGLATRLSSPSPVYRYDMQNQHIDYSSSQGSDMTATWNQAASSSTQNPNRFSDYAQPARSSTQFTNPSTQISSGYSSQPTNPTGYSTQPTNPTGYSTQPTNPTGYSTQRTNPRSQSTNPSTQNSSGYSARAQLLSETIEIIHEYTSRDRPVSMIRETYSMDNSNIEGEKRRIVSVITNKYPELKNQIYNFTEVSKKLKIRFWTIPFNICNRRNDAECENMKAIYVDKFNESMIYSVREFYTKKSKEVYIIIKQGHNILYTNYPNFNNVPSPLTISVLDKNNVKPDIYYSQYNKNLVHDDMMNKKQPYEYTTEHFATIQPMNEENICFFTAMLALTKIENREKDIKNIITWISKNIISNKNISSELYMDQLLNFIYSCDKIYRSTKKVSFIHRLTNTYMTKTSEGKFLSTIFDSLTYIYPRKIEENHRKRELIVGVLIYNPYLIAFLYTPIYEAIIYWFEKYLKLYKNIDDFKLTCDSYRKKIHNITIQTP